MGDSYTYDGFGNLTGMTPTAGSAPSLSVSVNAATYDGNGNVTQFGPTGALTTLTYDVINRIATVNTSSAYAYGAANERVYYRSSASVETLYIYGKDGTKLAMYTVAGISHGVVDFTQQSQNVYFAGRLISAEGNAVAVDALGTVRWNSSLGASEYYPYGVEFTATANDTEKYATYTRDSLTGWTTR